MFTRITLVLLLTVISFNISSCQKKKRMIPFPNTAINLISSAKSQNISRTEEKNAINDKVLDCADLIKKGYNESGVYAIWPIMRFSSMKRFYVYCDMHTDGGGWTVIQRRGDFKREDNYFDKDWESYKNGFGSIKKDFWIGNDNIFVLTNQRLYSVRFDLEDMQQNKAYAEYDKFWIGDESNNFTLHISDYSGTAGNSMNIHHGMKFSTRDRDNDNSSTHCGLDYKSGWWFNHCHNVNLNGLYNNKTQGIVWRRFQQTESLFRSEIKIRPIFY